MGKSYTDASYEKHNYCLKYSRSCVSIKNGWKYKIFEILHRTYKEILPDDCGNIAL